jgi:hypothetical protein
MIVFDEFQKKSHKKFDLNFESIEAIIFTINNAKNKHFSHEKRMISCMKENIHNREWQSWSSRCLFVSNANTQRFFHLRWLNQKIHDQKNSKNQANNSLEKKFNKEMFFKFNEFII